MSELMTRLESKIDDRSYEWSQPYILDLSNSVDRSHVDNLLDSGRIDEVRDPIEDIANDLFEMQHPNARDDESLRSEFVDDIIGQEEKFGNWAYFTNTRKLVRYPSQEEHQDLRTFRNRELITHEEQKRLLGARAAVFGLSVGSNVLEQLVQSGIGGHYMIGDFDTLSFTNLNRIHASALDVGRKKIDIAATKASEVDPYLKQELFRDGLTTDSMDKLAELKPQIIFDEIDDLAMKAMIRVFAKEHRIPVVMATDLGDTSIIDVERHDIENTDLFGGRLKPVHIDQLVSGEMGPATRQKLMIKIVGARNLTPRILQSAMGIDKTLSGLPQLGSTATKGGAFASIAARELLLDRDLKSGRYISSAKKTLNLQAPTSKRETFSIVKEFVKSAKDSK